MRGKKQVVFILLPHWPDICFPMKMCKDETITNKIYFLLDASLFSNVWTNVNKVPLQIPGLLFCPAGLGPMLNCFQMYKVVFLLWRELQGLLFHIPVKAVCGYRRCCCQRKTNNKPHGVDENVPFVYLTEILMEFFDDII